MTAGLQPPAEVPVVNEYQSRPRRVDDEATGRHVTRIEVVRGKGSIGVVEQLQRRGNPLLLGTVMTTMSRQQVAERRRRSQTNSMIAISAPSPRRGPTFTMRV